MSNKNKERLDKELVRRGFFSSRSKAKRSIMAGEVYVEGELSDKAGNLVETGASIEVDSRRDEYVSRGGLKLESALEKFSPDLEGNLAVDVGSSTGGFTHCLLKNGVASVWAVDVGKGQLAWKLRGDERVHVMEETNARYLSAEDFPEDFDLATVDVSFISLEHILKPLRDILKPEAEVIALVKPQFEAGPEKVQKGGVISDPEVHLQVLKQVRSYAEQEGFDLKGCTFSPITGKESKNLEFFFYLGPGGDSRSLSLGDVVEEAHRELK